MLEASVRPAHVWVPDYHQTYGDLAAGLGEQLGLVPDADQRMILDAIFAVRPDDTPQCFEVAVVAPRQNLKTATLELAALTHLFVFEEELVIWTAHLFDTAQKAFTHMKALVKSNPDFARRVHISDGKGDEAIELRPGGQRIEFHARASSTGRGATASKIILDEALILSPAAMGALLPTLATVPTAQVLYGSSAGMTSSSVLRGLRDRGRRGDAGGLAYFEWCAPEAECEQPYCTHRVGTVGCALDRVDLLRMANPAYGRRITAERMQQFREALPPEEFAREFLGWWDDPADEGGTAIAPDDWTACRDRLSRFGLGRTAMGLSLSGDRATAYIGAAGGRSDGLTHVEILTECQPSRVVAEVRALCDRRPGPVVIDPGSHAGSLIVPLEDAGVEVVQVTLQKLAAACGSMYDAVRSQQLRHIGQAQLDTAVAGASTRTVSRDSWVWKGPATTPLIAATLALHGYLNDDSGGWMVGV